jgi:hypothetical protein
MSDIQSMTIGHDRSNMDEYYGLVINKLGNANLAKLLTAKLLFFLSIHGDKFAHGDN